MLLIPTIFDCGIENPIMKKKIDQKYVQLIRKWKKYPNKNHVYLSKDLRFFEIETVSDIR